MYCTHPSLSLSTTNKFAQPGQKACISQSHHPDATHLVCILVPCSVSRFAFSFSAQCRSEAQRRSNRRPPFTSIPPPHTLLPGLKASGISQPVRYQDGASDLVFEGLGKTLVDVVALDGRVCCDAAPPPRSCTLTRTDLH